MDYRITQEELDSIPQPPSDEGEYPILKTLVSGATETPIQTGSISHDKLVNDGFDKLLPKLNEADFDVADMAAKNADAPTVALSLEAVQARMQQVQDNTVGAVDKVREISQAYIDHKVTTNLGLVINNSPAELAGLDKHTDGAVALTALEKAMQDTTKANTGIMRNVGGVLQEFIPTAAFSGFALGMEAQKYIGDVGTFEGESSIMQRMKDYYATLPNPQKAEFLKSWHKALTNSLSISEWRASLYISDLVSDDSSGVGTDILNAIGIGATLFNARGIVKGVQVAATGSKMMKNRQLLSAAVGGKPEEVAAVGQQVMRKGLFQAAGEATGVSDVMALGKLASSGLSRVLPNTLTTAASAVQELIKNKAVDAINDIRGTVRAGNLRPDEGALLVDQIKTKFDPNMNPMVHSLDINAAGAGRVFFKPADAGAQNFLTKEAAEEWIKVNDPSNSRGLSIVPDTTNTGYLVGADTLEEMKRSRAIVEADLLKKLADLPTKEAGLKLADPTPIDAVPVEPVVFKTPPQSLIAATPKYKLSEVTWADDVDKAVYQLTNKGKATKSDPEIRQWVKDVMGWDDAAIDAHGKALRDYIKRLPGANEGKPLTVSLQRPTTKGTPTAPKELSEQEALDSTYYKMGDNTYISPEVAKVPEALEYLSKVLSITGLDKARLVVLSSTDMLEPSMAHVAYYRKKHADAGGFHYRGDNGTKYIVINRDPKDKFTYINTLAHEVGHNFMFNYLEKFGKPVEDAFNKFLASKGRKTMTRADWETFFKFSSAGRMSVNFTNAKVGTKSHASGDWYNSFHEFFAEQFSKWSLADKVPTSYFDKTMASIVATVRNIFMQAMMVLKGDFGVRASVSADKTIARMMNDHVKEIMGGRMMGKEEADEIASLRKTLSDMDDQITAMSTASGGARYGWLVQQNFSPVKYSQLGKYSDEDINSIMKLNFGDWAFGTSSEAYANRVVGVAASSRYKKILTDFIQSDLTTLNKKQRELLSSALIKGDKEGINLDENTLRAIGLDTNGIKAYYAVRTARSIMYEMRNDAAVTSLTRKGYENVVHPNLVDDDGQMTFARQVRGDQLSVSTRVYDIQTKSGTSLGEATMRKLEAGTHRLMQTYSPLSFDGKVHRHILVPVEEATFAPIKTVIPYREGEFKRIYQNEYFVKMDGVEEVDGIATEFTAVHRTAKNKAEADAYIAAWNAVKIAARDGKLTPEIAAKLQPYGWAIDDVLTEFQGGKYNGVKLKTTYTRTEDDWIDAHVNVRNRFTSERGDRLKHVSGNDAEVANPFDSLAAEITNTAFMVPITEWRDATIYRWYNTVENYLPTELRGVDPERAFYEMQSANKQYVGNDKMRLFAQRVNDYVIHEMSVLTKEEQVMAGHIRGLTEWMEGAAAGKTMFEGAANMTGAWLRQADFVQFARTVSFHSFLGGLNPVQLVVQGLNAFNAITISPLHGLKAASWSGGLRMALMSDREDVWRKIAQAGKIAGVDADEFVLTVQSIRRSGLMDGINSTSLYGAETGKWSLTNGLMRKLGGGSAFFFNRGEEMSRLVSFDIARREFIAANPEAVWWDDVALNKILERQDDLTQNMTNANLGAYQKGVLSIPTQFLQYNIKFGMNILAGITGNKRAFSRKEIASLMMGHLLMFGVGGTAFTLTEFGQEMLGDTYRSMDKDTRILVDQGIAAAVIDAMSEAITGESTELAVGTRFGSLGFYTKFTQGMLDLFSTEAKDTDGPSVRDILTGAVGSAVRRLIGNTGTAWDLLQASEEVDGATLKEVFHLMGTGAFSSLNNIDKAMLAKHNLNAVMSRNGSDLFAIRESETLFLAMGVPPITMADYQTYMVDSKKRREQQKRFINEAKRLQELGAKAYYDGDKVLWKNYLNTIAVIRNGIANEQDRIAFDKALIAIEPKTKMRQLMEENIIRDLQAVPAVNQQSGEE